LRALQIQCKPRGAEPRDNQYEGQQVGPICPDCRRDECRRLLRRPNDWKNDVVADFPVCSFRPINGAPPYLEIRPAPSQ
jgi:hypothetical protein